MSIFRKLVLAALGLIALTSCGKTLDYAKIEAQIKEGITKEGGSSLKNVICPTDIKPEVGRTFECVGVLDSDSGFAIAVKQQDDQGSVIWDIASVKGLLNVAKLQDEFAQSLKKEVGSARVDCSSGVYRAAKPGETFECKLLKREEKEPIKVIGNAADAKPSESNSKPSEQAKPTENDFIQVTIQPTGDINWQRIIKVPASQVATLPTKDEDQKNITQQKTTKASIEPSSPRAPAAKSADDFLNQPGAADDFN